MAVSPRLNRASFQVMKIKLTQVAPAALAGACLAVAGIASGYAQAASSEFELASSLVTRTATVQSVDLDKREITLKSEASSPVTLTVGQDVARLNEIKPGDTVTAEFYVSLATEFRAPTESEKANPVTVLRETQRAGKDAPPGAADVRVYDVVATIEGIDRSVPSLTLKGPGGKFHTVKVKDPAKMKDLKLGEMIVVTYAEAMAVQVNKVDAKAKRN